MTPQPLNRGWTYLGLAIAFVAMPLTVGIFNYLQIPWTTTNILLREAAVWAGAVALALIIRRGEGLGWSSVGLQRPAAGNTALWVLITFVLVVAAAASAFGVIALFKWPFGQSADARSYEALPKWVMTLVIVRAGFVEELYYRGYLMERLQTLTGSKYVAFALPLVVFAVFHYRQGWAGITIALFTGAVLAGVYFYKRNLWITVITHFLGDFIPNILLPLFGVAPE